MKQRDVSPDDMESGDIGGSNYKLNRLSKTMMNPDSEDTNKPLHQSKGVKSKKPEQLNLPTTGQAE